MSETTIRATASEVHDTEIKKQSAELSRSIFADPKDFLQTIRANFSAIDQDQSGGISGKELVRFAETSTDAKAKAAAQLALEHYPELAALGKDLPDHAMRSLFGWTQPEGLTPKRLQLAVDIENNSPDQYIKNDLSTYKAKAWLDGGLGTAWAAVTAMHLSYGNAWFGAISGGLAVMRYAQLGFDIEHQNNDGRLIQSQFTKDRNNLDSWAAFRR